MKYEAVIGIETHIELATNSKMFCGCAVDFGAPPNTRVCPVCLGLPGAIPVPNERAIEWIVMIGLALDCDIAERSIFHRKNYFYPDLPKNYQISQYDSPICIGGHLEVVTGEQTTVVGITRVHMEEDTGKSRHRGEGGRIASGSGTLLDFNRSGVPLVEVVTEPDIRSAAEARAYATELQALVRSLGVSDAKLEEGSMRFDANISLRPVGTETLGTRAEIKNMNSLRSLESAVVYEIERQAKVLDAGESVVQETRHWSEDEGVTHSMRSKEESSDYRYFPEPDLVPLEVSGQWRDEIEAQIPELPRARRDRLTAAGLQPAAASQIAVDAHLMELFDGGVAAGGDARQIANWLTGEVVAYERRSEVAVSDTPLTAGHLAELASMVADGTVSATAAKEVLAGVLEGEGTPREVAAARDLIQLTDDSALRTAVQGVLDGDAEAAARIAAGDAKPIGFLVGQVMKATAGKADPKRVSELIAEMAGG